MFCRHCNEVHEMMPRPLVASVLETFRPRAAAKHQTIQLEQDATPITVQLDPDAMLQVLEKLVSNAV